MKYNTEVTMNLFRKFISICLLAVMIVSLIACAPAATAQTAKTPTKFVYAILSEPGSLDPGRITNYGPLIWMYNDLVTWSSIESKFVPNLAEKWENIDPTTWKFTLRKGVKFHNGQPMTSADVQFSFYRLMGKYDSSFMTMAGPLLKGLIDSIDTPDDYTAVFHTKYAESALPAVVHWIFILPKAYIEKVGDDAFAASPIGTGPYKFKARAIGESLTLEAFPDYFNQKPGSGEIGPAVIDTVIYRVIPEEQSRIAALKTGEVDASGDISADNAKVLDKDSQLKVYYTSVNAPIYLLMNWRTEKDPQTGEPNPFLDVRVRQAMNYALDLDSLMKNYGTGREYKTTMLGKGGIGYNPNVPFYKYDPVKAKQLLTDAGYPNGFTTKWYVIQSMPVFEAMQKYWKDVGINAQFSSTTAALGFSALASKKMYGIMAWGANSGPDPTPQFLEQVIKYNGNWAIHGKDDNAEKLATQAKAEFDVDKRAQITDQIIQITWKDAWFIPMWETVSIKAVSAKWDYTDQPQFAGVWLPALKGKK
jgi:peptide/nickel transport system substrate-binding protein